MWLEPLLLFSVHTTFLKFNLTVKFALEEAMKAHRVVEV
jgi:hypothetical protein